MKCKHLFYAVAALALFGACTNEDSVESGAKIKLEASWDGNESTRTVMAAGGSVYWTDGDNIYCNGTSYSGATFGGQLSTKTTKGDARYAKAYFTVDEAAAYSALYPNTLASTAYSGGSYTFTFPNSQAYYDDVTFGPKINPSTAYSTTTKMSFKNSCGIVKATINGDNGTFTDVKAVRFIAGGQALSGAAKVTPSATASNTAMSITDAYAKGTNDYMDVTFDAAVDLSATSPTVYWVLPPATYTTPVVELLNSSNKVVGKLTASKDVTVTRANITRLGTLAMNPYSAGWTVTYNINGGKSGTVPTDANAYTSSNNTVTVLAGTGLTGQSATPNFKCWNDKQDGSGTNYTANQTFTISGDVTLYAQWSATKYAQGYTMWDAKAPYPVGLSSYTSSTCGDSWYNTTPDGTKATNDCAGCPTKEQIMWYFKGGAYWDATNKGIWLQKKSSLVANNICTEDEFNTSATGGSADATMLESAPTDLSTNWFFLPAAGRYSKGSIIEAGTNGWYWLSSHLSTLSWDLDFRNGEATIHSNYARDYGFCVWGAE